MINWIDPHYKTSKTLNKSTLNIGNQLNHTNHGIIL